MADELTIPHSWKAFALYFLSLILANRASWIAALFKRKQSQAEAEQASAAAREAEMVNDLKSGDALVRLTVRMVAAIERAERNRAERDHWERKAHALESELAVAYHQLNQKTSINHLPPFKDEISP
jgi:hypothetical protein